MAIPMQAPGAGVLGQNPYLSGAHQALPGQAGGYQGLGNLLTMLQGGVNQSQYNNMMQGMNGTQKFGQIGDFHGAARGISPWAISYLMQNLMTKNAPQQTDTTGLTGTALTMANLENGLAANGPSTYSMASDVTPQMLQQLLGDYAASSGHGAYMHGANADGMAPPPAGRLPGRNAGGMAPPPTGHPGQTHGGMVPTSHPPTGHLPNRMHGAPAHNIYGYGLHGNPFHSRQAAIAAGRLNKGRGR